MKTYFKFLSALAILGFSSHFATYAQMGKCKGKYLGNVIQSSTTNNAGINYNTYWNQATSENGSKWGSVEGTQGVYNFTNSDIAYNWAKNNNGVFKYHNFVWGSQTPGYVASASTATLTTAIENYIIAVANHYNPMGGLKFIDVVNEPIKTALPGNYQAALTAGYLRDNPGGTDPYGWLIWPYQLARKYFPNAKLLINEYSIENDPNGALVTYAAMVNAIKNAPNLTDGKKNLIDGIGLQCHAFSIQNLSATNFKNALDKLYSLTGVNIHITELDLDANPNEAAQSTQYQALFPVAWNHPHVAGITIWGYVQGYTWRNGNGTAGPNGTDSGIMYPSTYTANPGGERPALTWIKNYMATQPDIMGCPLPATVGPTWGATVSITSPLSNSTFTAPGTINITAATGDISASVTSVAFYSGSTLLGTDLTGPTYSFSWSNVSAGTYTITAIATDNGGVTTTSSSINITVVSGASTTTTTSSKFVSIVNKKFVVGGSCPIYFNGANTPWESWNDFGGSYNQTKWAQNMVDLKSKGINASRIWISCNGAGQPSIASDGTASVPTAAFWNNCDHLFQQASINGVYIMATMMSFDHTKPSNPAGTNWQTMMASQAKTQTFIDNYLIPFANRYKDNPYLWSMDLCNEIEWIAENGSASGTDQNWGASYAVLQRFVGQCAAALHNAPIGRSDGSKVLITMGSAAMKWNGTKMRNGYNGTGWQNNPDGNKWSDAALQAQFSNSAAYLDFYSPHYYGWIDAYYHNMFQKSPTDYGIDEKACMVGEMPARDPMPTPAMGQQTAYNNLKTLGWQGHMPWTSNITANLTTEVGTLADFGAAALAFKNANPDLIYPICTSTVTGSKPTVTGSISGLSTVCAGQSGVSYSTTTIPGATSYSWILPSGASISSGAGTSNVSLTFGSISGTLSVFGVNSFGTGPGASFAINLKSAPVPLSSISGLNSICANQQGVIYAINTVSGANSYSWTLPSGATIASGAGSQSITVNFGSSSGNLSVVPIGTCGTGTGSSLSINAALLSTAGVSITSSQTTVCAGTSVAFTATGVNGGSAPTITWFKNGVSQSTGTTYSYVPANGDNVKAVYTTGGTGTACITGSPSTSNGINLTVNPILTSSVSITSSQTTVCAGTSVTFTATGVNGGSAPTITWFKNGVSQSTGTTYSYVPANGDNVKAVYTTGGTGTACITGSPSTSNGINLTVNPILTSSVSITSSQTTVCVGTSVTFTATGVNGGSAPTITWFKNGVSQSTGATYSYVPANGDNVKAVYTAGGTGTACITGSPSTSNGINLTVNPILTSSVSITSSQTTVCAGTSVAFTATGVNGGTAPTITWFKNGVSQSTGTTYSYVPANGDNVKAVYTAGGTGTACITGSPSTSNGINLTVNPILTSSVSIASSQTTVCTGTSVTFTATGVNGGTAPTITWFKNGVSQSTGATYSYVPANGDNVKAVYTAGGTGTACITGSPSTSNGINLTVNPILTSSVSITSSQTTVCAGTSVTFTATGVNGGSAPTITWFKNGVSQSTGTTYSYVPANGDNVKAVHTAGGTLPSCLSNSNSTSAGISINVSSTLVAAISIATPSATVCSGVNVSFTATGVNGGSSPTITWFKNNVSQGTGVTYGFVPSDGDIVRATMVAGGAGTTCITGSPANSSNIVLKVAPCPLPNPGSITGSVFVENNSTGTYSVPNVPGDTYQWTVPNGATIVSGQGTNSIVVSFGNAVNGSIGLTQTNTNGSTGVSLNVQSGNTPAIGAITGPAFVVSGASGVSYSVPNVSGDTYQWTVPSGATIVSGQGTNQIVVDFGTSTGGNVGLAQTNNFGTSNATIAVQTGSLPVITGIQGPSTVSNNATGVVYSVSSTAGVSYQWTVPAGANIVSGQGTNSISVNFGSSVAGFVLVSGSNSFGTAKDSLLVQTTTITDLSSYKAVFITQLYPNPTQNKFELDIQSTSLSPIGVEIVDLNGRTIDKYDNLAPQRGLEIGGTLPEGIYFVIITQGDTQKILKAVKIN